MRRKISLSWELAFATLVFFAALPMLSVRRPPIQDLPQHLAAIRVLADFGDPTLGFSRWFETALGSTQYLAYYLVARVLSIPLGVVHANQLLVVAAIAGTPYAMRALLRALGRDERLALFVLPLTWNAHLILGFFNFIAAIPLSLVGLTLAVRLRQHFTWTRFAALTVVGLVTFYTHVVPFAFFGLGTVLVVTGDGARASLRRLLALVPAAGAAVLWSQTAPAGRATLTAASRGSKGIGPLPTFMTWPEALKEAPGWLTDVLHDDIDDKLLVVYALLLLGSIALGAGRNAGDDRPTLDETLLGSLARRIGLLAPIAALAYFVAPSSYDWIWPINARFPLLALIFLVPVLPAPRRLGALAVYSGLAAISLVGSLAVRNAFLQYSKHEVGELDGALAVIPPGKKVAGLMFSISSRWVKFSPLIHSVAWYQAEKGGAVMFTFADFAHSPFHFRSADRPPKVPPRWEWMPARVDPRRDLGWYEYVLVQGGPGRIEEQQDTYERIFQGPRWTVWKRRASGVASAGRDPPPERKVPELLPSFHGLRVGQTLGAFVLENIAARGAGAVLRLRIDEDALSFEVVPDGDPRPPPARAAGFSIYFFEPKGGELSQQEIDDALAAIRRVLLASDGDAASPPAPPAVRRDGGPRGLPL